MVRRVCFLPKVGQLQCFAACMPSVCLFFFFPFFFTHEVQSRGSCLLRSLAETLHNNFPDAALNLSEQFQPVEGENPFGSMRGKPSVQLAGVGAVAGGRGGGPATRRGRDLNYILQILKLSLPRSDTGGGGGINDFAENIKLRRKLQRFRRRQPWSAASEAIFAFFARPAADKTPPLLPPPPHSYGYSNN